MSNPRSWRSLAALVLGCATLLGAMSAHAVFNPPIRMVNGIEYMTGGVGSDEAELMQSIEPRWPASFEFAVKDGKTAEFAASVVVTIRDASGRPVLSQITAGGPFLVARLDPGHYEVEATLAGQTLKQPVEVVQGTSSHTRFLWSK